MDRDDSVADLANPAYWLDVKERLDWRITNSASVPESVLIAAQQISAVKIDKSLEVQPVGVRIRADGDHVVLRMTSNREDHLNLIVPSLWKLGPPGGTGRLLICGDDDVLTTNLEPVGDGCKGRCLHHEKMGVRLGARASERSTLRPFPCPTA
jgi:hypothetical protein